jgi:hypothetical protein
LGKGKLAWPSYLLLFLIVLAAAFLRLPKLGERPMWVDEAESAINAITILQHGVPVDHYLGLPLYENTLIEPWPDHPEYAYRDSSYSRSGYAIYHGWVPLYLIAGGLKAVGIEPDVAPRIEQTPKGARMMVRNDPYDRSNRAGAARLPMAILGVLMVPLAWLVAREMGGTTAAWAAALLVALNATMIEFSRQARYYIPTIFFSLLCVWLLVRLWTRRRHFGHRDALAFALACALLFHTHLTTAFAMCLVGAIVIACMPWTRRTFVRLVPAALLFAALTVPWLLAVGFFETSSKLPSAWQMMELPADLLKYPRTKLLYVFMVAVLLAWLAISHRRFAHWVPRPLSRAGRRITPAVLILVCVVTGGYLVFSTMIPAASYFPRRLTMSIFGPGVLLVALLLGTAADLLGRGLAAGLARLRGGGLRRVPVQWLVLSVTTAAVLLHLMYMRRLPADIRFPEGGGSAPAAVRVMSKMWLTPETKLYATPNDHLPITFYGGVPVQSIAPVRKSFLDSYPHPVVIVQASAERQALQWGVTRDFLESKGVAVTEEELDELSILLHQHRALKLVGGLVAEVKTTLPPPPQWVEEWNELQDSHFSRATSAARRTLAGGMLMRRPFKVSGPSEWWRIFFLRFCECEPPNPPPLVWRDRVKNASASLLNYGEVVYYSPGPVAAQEHIARTSVAP